jgi:hypothetical protein
MGFFDLPAPLLSWIDQALFGALPPVFRLVAWGLIGGVLSMGLYKLISPQARIGELRLAAAEARRRMAAYDGEFSGLGEVAFASLGLSLRHVGVVLLPAIIASLPVLCLLVWLSNGYGYRLPDSNAAVAVKIEPAEAAAAWQNEAGSRPDGASEISWPATGEIIRLLDAQQRVLVELPLPAAVPVVHKRQWWNLLLGNPIGYLPAEGAVERVTISLPPKNYLDVEPAWLGGWEMIFLTVLFAASVAIKVTFRIH